VAHVDAVFAALADPTRRQVIERLAAEPTVTATQLASELPITRQAVAKHLGALTSARLATAERHGRETRYRLEPDGLSDAASWMADVGLRWDERLAALAASATRSRGRSGRTPPPPRA
jgi:DNA-binding transcriptional ArsR family regulator